MSNTHISFIPWRFYLILLIISLIIIILIWRLIDLAVINKTFLRKQGDERALRLVNHPALRGMILDRNGSPLAVSTIVYSVWINPHEFTPSSRDLLILAKQLGLKPKAIADKLL